MSSRAKTKQANRVVRDQLAREERKRRLMIITIIAGALIVIAGLIGWGISSSQKSTKAATPVNASADGVGLKLGGEGGKAKVELYVDYLCPHCKEFEEAAAASLDQWMSTGKAEVIIHPVAILDEASTTDYSTRAAAAAACASDGGKLKEFTAQIFAQQPAEGGAGLSDDQLVAIGKGVGLGDDFASCVHDGKYLTWVPKGTEAASARGLTGTPTVFVDDKMIPTPVTLEAVTKAVEASQ